MPKATNISCYEAEQIKYLPSNTVLISINEEELPLRKLNLDRQSNKILTVRFNDITAPKEYNGTLIKPINFDTCLKILDFININQGKDFIIHCHAGISRSAAICLYLHIIHGYELKPNFWKTSKPNKFVLGALMINRYQK